MTDDKPYGSDIGFLHAIINSGRDGRHEALTEYLLSDRPLGPGERLALVELITGQWKRPKGKPINSKARQDWREKVTCVREECDRLLASGERKSLEEVALLWLENQGQYSDEDLEALIRHLYKEEYMTLYVSRRYFWNGVRERIIKEYDQRRAGGDNRSLEDVATDMAQCFYIDTAGTLETLLVYIRLPPYE